MDVHEIKAVGKAFEAYLAEFSDCFGRCDTASYLGVYVEGQHSGLQRKSAEPIALRAGIPPRSLQVFLASARWDEERMVNRVQEIVARDHSHPFGIGLVDETGSPLEWLVYVAYSRWPIEQCFKEEKDELGFDHFEVRGWRSIHRHMVLTQVSHLYLNRMRKQLMANEHAAEEAGFFSLPRPRRRSAHVSGGKLDPPSDPRCRGRLVRRVAVGAAGS